MRLANHTAHYQRDAEEFDYFAPRSGADLDAALRIQQGVLQALPQRPLSRVLDLGSGSGWLFEAMQSDTGTAALDPGSAARVVSVDLGIENLRKLRRRFPHAALVAADAERLPFRHGSFDAAVASEVLEHLNRPALVLRQLNAVLVKSGRLVVSTPYRETIRYYLCIHCDQPTPVNAHLHSFDEHTLKNLFEEGGFRDVRFLTFQNKALVFLRLSLLLRFLPWTLWRLIDRMCNLVLRKPHSIVISGDR